MADRYTSRTLREIVRVIAGRFLGMVIIFAVVVAAVGVATHLAPAQYRAEAPMMARPSKYDPLETEGVTLTEQVSLFVTTQRQIITSNYVLASALMRLNDIEPVGGKFTEDNPWYTDEQIDKFIRENPNLIRRMKRRVNVLTPGGPDATFTQTFKIQVDWVEQPQKASQANMDPRKFAAKQTYDLTKFVREAYLMRFSQLETRKAKNAADFLKSASLAQAKAELEEANKKLKDYVDTEIMGNLLQVRNLLEAAGTETGAAFLTTEFQSEINNISARIAEIDGLVTQINETLQQAQQANDSSQVVVPDAITEANPSISKLQTTIVNLKLTLNGLEPKYTDNYQQLQNVRDELAAARDDLINELQKQRRRLLQEKAVAQTRQKALESIVSKDRQEMDKLATMAINYQQLKDDRDTTRKLYNDVRKELLPAITQEQLAANPILVLPMDEIAMPDPDQPRRPIFWLNMVIAVAGGFVLSLIYAFMADHFDHSIKSIDEAERYLGAPVLASVPKLGWRVVRSGDGAKQATLKPKAQEVFKGLWASLFYSGKGGTKSVIVCAADRQEGTSLISAGLALAGTTPAGPARVALVDFNLRNPALGDILQIKDGPGLAEAVLEDLPVEQAARSVNPGLDVYPVGNVQQRALEIIRSDGTRNFFRQLGEQYDHVIVDAPAANRFPEAQVLAGILKNILLVTHTEQTPREAVAQAQKRIEAGGGILLGMVLNMRTYPIPGFLYRRV